VIEAVRKGTDLQKVMIKNGLKGEQFHELISLLKEAEVPYQFVPVERLNRVTGKNHQGIIAFTSPVEYTKLDMLLPQLFEKGEVPFILVLDGITDVRNFGAISRTANCTGVHAVVVPAKGAAAVNEEAMKTSAGALHYTKLCREFSLKETVRFLQNSGIRVVAATEKVADSCFQADLTGPVAIVMGAEDKGVSGELLKIVDEMLSIPVMGEIGSLNVSVAAGVLMYEVVRRRQ
jgi:23S rRNA (guanosine2251-2'-O)-methyltransferase